MYEGLSWRLQIVHPPESLPGTPAVLIDKAQTVDESQHNESWSLGAVSTSVVNEIILYLDSGP